jgi:transposase
MVCINFLMHIMSRAVTVSRHPRRQHSAAFKSELIARSLEPGASVSAIALENGLNTNLLFAWRRKHIRAMAKQAGTKLAKLPIMLPVHIESVPPAPYAAPEPPRTAVATGAIEIDVGGACVRLRGAVDEASLRCVLRVLRGLDA